MNVWHVTGSKGAHVGIGLPLVVAGDDPDFAPVLHADLRRPEDVAGGMERDARVADGERTSP